MTDRELLELAAKAAGYKITFEEPIGVGFDDYYPHGYDEDGDVESWWNPLANDGDALRLAVDLELDIEFLNGDTFVLMVSQGGGDKYERTRRAIVLAAARIGRSMP